MRSPPTPFMLCLTASDEGEGRPGRRGRPGPQATVQQSACPPPVMQSLVARLHNLILAPPPPPPLTPIPTSLRRTLRLLCRRFCGRHDHRLAAGGPGLQEGRPPSLPRRRPTHSVAAVGNQQQSTDSARRDYCLAFLLYSARWPAFPLPPTLLQVRMQHRMRSNCYIVAALADTGSSCITPRALSLAPARVKSSTVGFEVCRRSRRPPKALLCVAVDLHRTQGTQHDKSSHMRRTLFVHALTLPSIHVNINSFPNLAQSSEIYHHINLITKCTYIHTFSITF